MDSGEPLPTLTPTRSGVSWRLPALAVGLALVAIVGLTRLGGPERPTPTVAPSALAVVPATPAPNRPSGSPVFIQLPGVMRQSPDGLTYADGIPTAIDGQAVYRVRHALSFTAGRTLLVGGWYIDRRSMLRECAARRGEACASPTISDVPLTGPRVGDVTTDFVALDTNLDSTGAYVVLATLETDPRCSIYAAGECLPRLHVLAPVWSGPG